MGKKIGIDFLNVLNSIRTLQSLDNILHSFSFSSYFDELDQYFKELNFEHTNYIRYKEYLDKMYSDLDDVKRSVAKLSQSLQQSLLTFSDQEDLSSEHITQLMKMYSHYVNHSNLNDIMGSSDDSFSTVPIGIAIGATGIAGSIGAVLVNEAFSSKNNSKPKTRPRDVLVEEYHVKSSPEQYGDLISHHESPEPGDFDYQAKPYNAMRNQNRFNPLFDDYPGESDEERRSKADYSTSLQDVNAKEKDSIVLEDSNDDDYIDDFY